MSSQTGYSTYCDLFQDCQLLLKGAGLLTRQDTTLLQVLWGKGGFM